MQTGERIKEIFAQAIGTESSERDRYLTAACAGDAELRRQVEALVEAHEQAGNFLHPTIRVTASDLSLEPTGAMIGRYKILERIGEGGFGSVYMAEQTHPVQRKVALKIIKAGMDTREVVARFEAERQALALMDHPNIARVLDAGATQAGRPFFVMELVRGIPITDFCDQRNLSIPERLELLIKVCYAVQHAHQKGIIHRDIKPSNVLVTVHDGMPMPKVIDFGVAKALGQKLTEKTLFTGFAHMIGTPAYMSPEQTGLIGLDIDTRADIYSLGVLLYELLTGVTPFNMEALRQAALDEIRRMIRETDPPRPSTRLQTLGEKTEDVARRHKTQPATLSRAVRGDLDCITMRCLEKDRQRRYETASALAMDLQRHLKGEAVLARPPSAFYRFQTFARRNRAGLLAATLVALSLVVGVAVSTSEAVRATRAERMQRELRQQAQANEQKAKQAQADETAMRQRAEAGEKNTRRLLYVANLNLLQQAWDQNNIDLVRELLDETATYQERGFEWYYWQRQTHLTTKTLRSRSRAVFAVAFFPDGKRIVTGNGVHTATVWDLASGKELITLKKEHGPGTGGSVACSPDGQRIVTVGDGLAKLWEAASGKELLTFTNHGMGVRSVAFSPDGQRIVSGGYDRTARVWEAATGVEFVTFSMPRVDSINAVAFSPDGRWILSGGAHEANVWEATSGKDLLTLRVPNPGYIQAAAISPNGQWIVTAGGIGHTATVWDLATGKARLTLQGHSGMITSVAFSPDGQRIVTGSQDRTAKIWEAAFGKELFTLKGHSDVIYSVAFSPDGLWIATGSCDGTARLWEAISSQKVVTLKGQGAGIRSTAVSPDGQRIFTDLWDGAGRVWDAASGKELLAFKQTAPSSPAAAFSPDGQRIVARSSPWTAIVREVASGKELLTLKSKDEILSVAFSPDAHTIVTGGHQVAKVWDAARGKELFSLGHGSASSCVGFSPDGRKIVTLGSRAKLWEAASGKELLTFEAHGHCLAFSPDGKRIVTSSRNKAKVWDVTSGKELRTLQGHKSEITSLGFSPDGRRIVTVGDMSAKVWEADIGRELLTLREPGIDIHFAGFLPDNKRIVTVNSNWAVKVWHAASPEEVAAWQKEEFAGNGRKTP